MATDEFKNTERTSTGDVDWSVYLQEGVVVDLQIKRYRGVTTVDFSELGIDEGASSEFKKFLDSYMKPGQKRLIPPEIEGQLKSIETSARQNLKECSFDCSAFSIQGKFVPRQAYRDFKEANSELEARFFAIRDEFANDYERIIEQVRKDYKVLAENLYMQSHPNVKRPNARYVNAFVSKIIEQIPPKEEIVASFEYNTFLRHIPDYLLNVIKKKNNIDERAMKIAASNPNGKPVKQDEEKSKPAAKPQKPADIAEEIENDIQESINNQSVALVDKFVTDILMRLRTMAFEGSAAIIDSIERNEGKFVGRASIKAHSLVEDLRKMDFYGDENLQKTVDALEQALVVEEGKTRNVNEIKAAAHDMKSWSQKSINELNRTTKSKTAKKTPVKKTSSTRTTKTSTTKAKQAVKITVPKKSTPKRTVKKR